MQAWLLWEVCKPFYIKPQHISISTQRGIHYILGNSDIWSCKNALLIVRSLTCVTPQITGGGKSSFIGISYTTMNFGLKLELKALKNSCAEQ